MRLRIRRRPEVQTANGEKKEETAFVDCTLFGKGAEVFNQYVNKGKQCYIEGRLRFDTWEDKATGQKRSKLTVVVEDFQFLGAPGDGQQAEQRQSARPAARPNEDRDPPHGDDPAYAGGPGFTDDDIPY